MEQQKRSPSCLLLLVHRIHSIIIVLQVNSNYPIDTITFQHTLFLNTVGTSEKWHQHPTILQFKSKQEGGPGSRKPVVSTGLWQNGWVVGTLPTSCLLNLLRIYKKMLVFSSKSIPVVTTSIRFSSSLHLKDQICISFKLKDYNRPIF